MITEAEHRHVFESLFDEHRQGVWAFFLGRHADPGTAEELTQETFLRLWRRVGEVGGLDAGAQRGWIFRVARNLSVDTYRNRAAGRSALRDVADGLSRAPGGVADAADEAISRERLAEVDAAIMALPEAQRLVITMSAVGGLRAVDIATALGEPAGTVRYRLSMARRTLRSMLIMETELEESHGRA